jgi:hypothetical protein
MLTAAVSANLLSQVSPDYFQQRRADLQQLGKDLQSGNLSAAQQDFSAIQTLAQSGPFGGDSFKLSNRQQDFAAIGQALQAGDLAGAQAAYSQLQSTFNHKQRVPPPTADPIPASGSSAPQSGSEIVLNLGTLTPGEQININIANGANGSEQVSVGISGQGSAPEQINFNLSSNQQIVLNLFNSSASSSSQGSSLSVSA